MALAGEFGNFGRDSRAVSETVGYVLIFAMVLGGTTVVVTIGGAALTDAQGQAEMQRAEHSMTLFDSRAAMVALGESGTQSVSFGQDSGSFETRPEAGYLAIKHVDWNSSKDPEELFNESLGTMVYQNGDTELAYQGGGVWRQDPEGAARMISPPEFHYRGATLTLPVIRVKGTSSASGTVTTRMTAATQARKVYPNASSTYPTTTREFQNPIENGTVDVYVKSRYYEGWAEYFRQRTSGNVTVFESNKTVRLELMSLGGSPGEFPMPLEGESLEVGGFGDGHPINDFELTLKADGNFNNGHWSLYNSKGNDEFEMHIYSEGKCNGGSYNKEIDFSIYYYNDSTGEVQEWQNSSIDPNDPDTAFDVDCSAKELTVDFMSTNTNLSYKDVTLTGTNNKWCYGDHIDARPADSPISPRHHSEDGTRDYEKGTGDNATMKWVVNHYTSRLGTDYDLTVKDGPGNNDCLSGGAGSGSSRVDESASSGTLRYDEASGSQYITYLHVTENQVNVTFD